MECKIPADDWQEISTDEGCVAFGKEYLFSDGSIADTPTLTKIDYAALPTYQGYVTATERAAFWRYKGE